MNCRTARQRMQLGIDGELPLALRAELRAHLGACGDCQRVQRQLNAMSAALAELKSATDDADGGILRFERPRRRRWALPMSLAAAIALLLAAWPMLHHRGDRVVRVVEQPPIPRVAPAVREATNPAAPILVSSAPSPRINVRISRESNMLGVPVATRNPNITILRLYPKIQLASSPQSARERGS